jgi:TIGR03009 family protein
MLAAVLASVAVMGHVEAQQPATTRPRTAQAPARRPNTSAPTQRTPQQGTQQAAPPQQNPATSRPVASRPQTTGPRATGPQYSAPQGEGQAPAGDPAQPPAPRSPFQLTPVEQQALDAMLGRWEAESQKIQTLKVSFMRYEYDEVFDKEVKRVGELKYKRPDVGLYRVEGDPSDKSAQFSEHWFCDGQSIYEFKYDQKELVERPLPPELKGKAIEDGPLPFLFNTEAAKLKKRYFLRLMPAQNEGEVWIEAYPRWQQDAANFIHAQLILREKDMLPVALQIFLPNGQSRTVHAFDMKTVKINDPLSWVKRDFVQPTAPPGWKYRRENPPAVADAPAPAEGPRVSTAPRQAEADGYKPVGTPR